MCLGDLIKAFRQEYTSSNEDGGGDLEIGSGCIFRRFAVYFFYYIPPPKECVMLFWGGKDPLREQLSNSSSALFFFPPFFVFPTLFLFPPLCLFSKSQLLRRGTETLPHSLHQAASPGAGEGISL